MRETFTKDDAERLVNEIEHALLREWSAVPIRRGNGYIVRTWNRYKNCLSFETINHLSTFVNGRFREEIAGKRSFAFVDLRPLNFKVCPHCGTINFVDGYCKYCNYVQE